MDNLIKEISACTVCSEHLPLGPRPIVSAHPKSKIVIIGQAPGTAVHKTGIPWNDKSGENLRKWMNITTEDFYDATKVSIIPMGFCYPGKGKSGDLPPRKECAPLWHKTLFDNLEGVELILLIGKYAQDYYLEAKAKRTLTETVKNCKEYLPKYFVLPHPSPRNNIWQAKNEWFSKLIIPELQREIESILK
tara:strand:+ start:1875 stop:2447 length:573 start_codon:yes stop_codon:yes gene_type:complete